MEWRISFSFPFLDIKRPWKLFSLIIPTFTFTSFHYISLFLNSLKICPYKQGLLPLAKWNQNSLLLGILKTFVCWNKNVILSSIRTEKREKNNFGIWHICFQKQKLEHWLCYCNQLVTDIFNNEEASSRQYFFLMEIFKHCKSRKRRTNDPPHQKPIPQIQQPFPFCSSCVTYLI